MLQQYSHCRPHSGSCRSPTDSAMVSSIFKGTSRALVCIFVHGRAALSTRTQLHKTSWRPVSSSAGCDLGQVHCSVCCISWSITRTLYHRDPLVCGYSMCSALGKEARSSGTERSAACTSTHFGTHPRLSHSSDHVVYTYRELAIGGDPGLVVLVAKGPCALFSILYFLTRLVKISDVSGIF